MSDDRTVERWLATLEHTPLGPISCAVSVNGLTQIFFTGLEEARHQLDAAGLMAHVPLSAGPSGTEDRWTDRKDRLFFENAQPGQGKIQPPGKSAVLQAALDQVQLYLQRQLHEFDLPLDLSDCTAFQRQVLDEVMRIPYGQVVTYGAIAEKVGGMKKVRAVGGAVGSNPMPLVIPCHRVLASNGDLVGYSGRGGVKTKAWLLTLEGYFLVTEELD